jgi:hypothetical protein
VDDDPGAERDEPPRAEVEGARLAEPGDELVEHAASTPTKATMSTRDQRDAPKLAFKARSTRRSLDITLVTRLRRNE